MHWKDDINIDAKINAYSITDDLFFRIQLTIATYNAWTKYDPIPWHHMASLNSSRKWRPNKLLLIYINMHGASDDSAAV